MRQHDVQEAFDLLLVHAASAVDETAAASLVDPSQRPKSMAVALSG